MAFAPGWLNVLRRQILDFVGLKVARMKTIGSIRGATPAGTTSFKDAARRLAS